jgi:uncharacterized phage protein gp47/JayE
MPDFPTDTREELEQRGRDLIRTRRRGADVSYGSDYDLSARLLAALAWGMKEQAKVALRMLDPRQAFGDYLSALVDEAALGPSLAQTTAAAAKATGKVILLSTTASQTQLAGSVLRHADGTQYTLDADATTPATAAKVLRAGDRSGRRRLFQGHVGGGFVTAAAGEVYQHSSGEYCALRDVENRVTLQRYLFDLYNELDVDPVIQDQFAQRLGVVGSITASVAGASANKDAKDVLTVVSPAGTIVATAYILELSGGTDAMQAGAKQSALRDAYAVRQGPGTIQDLRQLALGYPRAPLRECYVVPATNGISTYTILPIHADGQYVGATQLADILAYVNALVSPVDKVYGAAVYEKMETAIDFVNVQVSEVYAPDWTLPDQSVRGLTITTPGSSTLVVDAVGDLAIGDRVMVSTFGSTQGPYIVQRRVATLAGLTIGLDQPLPFPPDPQSYVTPGGPLGQAIIDAIHAAYDQRAPSVGDTGPQVRLPISTVTNDPQGIVAAVSNVPGVLDAECKGGSAPALSGPGGVLVPGWVIRMYVEV